MRTPLVKHLLFLTLMLGFFSACAQKSYFATSIPDRLAFAIHGHLSESDITQVVAALRQVPQIEHNIAWIEVKSSHSIQVYTGYVYGPLAGGGNVVEMKKQGEKWRVIGNPQTSVWNA